MTEAGQSSDSSRNALALLRANWKPLAAVVASLTAGCCFAYSKRLPASEPHVDWSHMLFGHRGCRLIRPDPEIPENTIPAFAYCREHGAHGIELDIRICKSGELVVHHDDMTAPILTEDEPGAVRRIADLTLAELRQLHYAADPTQNVVISTAAEALRWAKNDIRAPCHGGRCRVLLEFKSTYGLPTSGAVQQLIALYRDPELREFMERDVTVISFDPRVLYALRKAEPESAKVMQLMRKDAASAAVRSSGDAAPWIFRHFPGICDVLMWSVVYKYAPFFLNAGIIGPHWQNFSVSEIRRLVAGGDVVYLWGFSRPAQLSSELRRMVGVFAAADDDFEEFLN